MSSSRKFRVWDGEEMHEPPHEYVWAPRGGARRVIDASDGRLTCSQSIDGEVLWSTGLTDAEGQEIWEGDIMRCEGKKYEVEWVPHSGGFGVGAAPVTEDVAEFGWVVIGNRYENPELLDER